MSSHGNECHVVCSNDPDYFSEMKTKFILSSCNGGKIGTGENLRAIFNYKCEMLHVCLTSGNFFQ